MRTEYHKWYCGRLNRDMELKVYGDAGRPIIVYPCHGGRFYEWEDFGMFATLERFIESGQYQFICLDSIDGEPWSNELMPIHERGKRHSEYENYVINEVVPFIQSINKSKSITTCGFSMGAYHAFMIQLHYPDVFDEVIAMSGLMRLNIYIEDYYDEYVENFSPIHFIEKRCTGEHLAKLRDTKIILCTGQGQWEEETVEDLKLINPILWEKKISAWVDFWGTDVAHDWPWWKIELPYYLDKLHQIR